MQHFSSCATWTTNDPFSAEGIFFAIWLLCNLLPGDVPLAFHKSVQGSSFTVAHSFDRIYFYEFHQAFSDQFIHFIDRFFPFNIFFKHSFGKPVTFNPLRTDVLCSKLYPVLPFLSLSLFLSFMTQRLPFYLLTQFSPKTLYSHEIFRSKVVTRGGVSLTHDIIYDFSASSSQGIILRDTIKALAVNLDGLELL